MAISGILIISFLCFVINSPHFGNYYAIPDNEREEGMPAYDYTEFGKGNGSKMYEFWVHCMFIVLVPWITILCLNLMIICRVTKLNRYATSPFYLPFQWGQLLKKNLLLLSKFAQRVQILSFMSGPSRQIQNCDSCLPMKYDRRTWSPNHSPDIVFLCS